MQIPYLPDNLPFTSKAKLLRDELVAEADRLRAARAALYGNVPVDPAMEAIQVAAEASLYSRVAVEWPVAMRVMLESYLATLPTFEAELKEGMVRDA